MRRLSQKGKTNQVSPVLPHLARAIARQSHCRVAETHGLGLWLHRAASEIFEQGLNSSNYDLAHNDAEWIFIA